MTGGDAGGSQFSDDLISTNEEMMINEYYLHRMLIHTFVLAMARDHSASSVFGVTYM